MNLVHWLLIGGLLHLVQRGGDWAILMRIGTVVHEQGHETIDFGGQNVKSQGHTRPNRSQKIPFSEISQKLSHKF